MFSTIFGYKVELQFETIIQPEQNANDKNKTSSTEVINCIPAIIRTN